MQSLRNKMSLVTCQPAKKDETFIKFVSFYSVGSEFSMLARRCLTDSSNARQSEKCKTYLKVYLRSRILIVYQFGHSLQTWVVEQLQAEYCMQDYLPPFSIGKHRRPVLNFNTLAEAGFELLFLQLFSNIADILMAKVSFLSMYELLRNTHLQFRKYSGFPEFLSYSPVLTY